MKPSDNFAPVPITKEELSQGSLAHLPPITAFMIDPHGALNQVETLPGKNGLPFRGTSIPNLKDDDPLEAQPKRAVQGHAAVFDLSDPAHLNYYQTLFHLVYNGRATVGQERVDFSPTTGKYMAFVRWGFEYCYSKPGSFVPGLPARR